MATVVLGVVGNAIFPGVGGVIGAGVGAVIDTLITSAVARSLTPDLQPPDILKHPTADEGTPAPWCYGPHVRISGQLIYLSDIRQQGVLGSQKGKDDRVVAYNYFADIGIAWCRNECTEDPVTRMWASGELVFSRKETLIIQLDQGYALENQQVWLQFNGTGIPDGNPWCEPDNNPTQRLAQERASLRFATLMGSQEDADISDIVTQAPNNYINISDFVNGANDGTYFCVSLVHEAVVGLLNTWEMILLRCSYSYPPNDPCEPSNAGACDPVIDESAGSGPSITLSPIIDNFSKYFNVMDSETGGQTQVANSLIQSDPNIDGTLVPAFRGTCYSVIQNMDITKWGATLPQFEAEIRQIEVGFLKDTVDAILKRSESVSPFFFDTTGLDNSQLVHGIFSVGPTPPINLIRQLMQIYDFEVQELVEVPNLNNLPISTLTFVYRDDLERVLIKYDKTSAREIGNEGRPHASIRRQTKENLPQEFVVDFINIERDLQPGSTSYAIKTAPVRNQQKLTTAVTLFQFEADLLCRKLLWTAISHNDSVSFNVPVTEFTAVEGDRIGLSELPDGTTLQGRVVRRDRGESNMIEYEAQIDDEQAYDQNQGGDYATAINTTVELVPYSAPAAIDISPLNSAEASQFGLHTFLIGNRIDTATQFLLFASIDQVTWTNVATFSLPAVSGVAMEALNDVPDPHNWDEQSAVLVRLDNASVLESLSKEQVEAGMNWAYLGGEIIGFRDVDPQEEIWQYELSGLLRGRNDTFPFTSTHQEGETFYLLPPSGGGIVFTRLEPAFYQVPLFLRMVPPGRAVTDAESAETEFQIIPNAETLRPFSVHGLWSIRQLDASTCVYATDRTRVPFRLWSGLIPPFVETGGPEDFKADLYWENPTSTWEFLRQVEACRLINGQLAFGYTRAMQIEDLHNTGKITDGSFPGLVRFVIYRESDTIGPGREREWCVTVTGVQFETDCAFP